MDIVCFWKSQVFSCKTVEMLFINILEKSQLLNGREPCPLILLRWFQMLILQYKGQLELCYTWLGCWTLVPVTASLVKGAKTGKIDKLVKKCQIPKRANFETWGYLFPRFFSGNFRCSLASARVKVKSTIPGLVVECSCRSRHRLLNRQKLRK